MKLNNKLIILLILVVIIANHNLFANNVEAVFINPLNKAVIQFDKLPSNIRSSLSDDKTKITIKIDKVNLADSLRQTSGLGVITDIYFTKNDSTSIINIKTKERRGYTLSKYPFTAQIAVEVFSWDKLDSEEDAFRTGILAEEDGIYNESFVNYYKAARKSYAPAYYFLGMLYLKFKYFNEAKICLSYAYNKDTTNLDALAGLALAKINLGDTLSSNQLLNEYRKRINKPLNLTINYETNLLDSSLLDLSFVNMSELYSENNNIDTTLAGGIAKIDSSSLSNNDESVKESPLELILANYELILFLIGAIGLLVLYMYLKWRQNKLEQIKLNQSSQSKLPFDKELSKASANINPKQAINLYTGDEKKSDTKEKTTKVSENNVKPEAPKTPTTRDIVSDKKLEELTNYLDTLTGKTISKEANPNPNSEKNQTNLNPKLQLAIHLADEQKKIKNQNIENLKLSAIPTDTKKLSEFSKQLGIERGGIETKATIEKILQDEEKLKKLSDKFGL